MVQLKEDVFIPIDWIIGGAKNAREMVGVC
jgi:hypothetical protein